MSTALALQQPTRAPLGAIAKAFLTVSVFGFGGGIVWARRIAVEQAGLAQRRRIPRYRQPLPVPTGAEYHRHRGLHRHETPRRAGSARRDRGISCAALERGFGTWRTLPSLCASTTASPCPRRGFGSRGRSSGRDRVATSLAYRRRPLTVGLAVLALVLMTFSRLPLPLVLVALLPLSIVLSAARRT
jgi:hypothetical protein